jgi:hypothetical protein
MVLLAERVVPVAVVELVVVVVPVAMARADHPARRMAVEVAEGPTPALAALARDQVHARLVTPRRQGLHPGQPSSTRVKAAIRLTWSLGPSSIAPPTSICRAAFRFVSSARTPRYAFANVALRSVQVGRIRSTRASHSGRSRSSFDMLKAERFTSRRLPLAHQPSIVVND